MEAEIKVESEVGQAMRWYQSLNTESLARVVPHINQLDSRTIVAYWKREMACMSQSELNTDYGVLMTGESK